jgi:hypothetical protein
MQCNAMHRLYTRTLATMIDRCRLSIASATLQNSRLSRLTLYSFCCEMLVSVSIFITDYGDRHDESNQLWPCTRFGDGPPCYCLVSQFSPFDADRHLYVGPNRSTTSDGNGPSRCCARVLVYGFQLRFSIFGRSASDHLSGKLET